MIDIPKVPSPSVGRVPNVSATSSFGTNILTNIPGAVLSLPKDSLLQALVKTQDGKGNVVLDSPRGPITVQSNAVALKPGDSVLLQVLGNTPHFEAKLVSVNGAPPTVHTPTQAASPTSAATPQQAATNVNVTPSQDDIIFRATPQAQAQIQGTQQQPQATNTAPATQTNLKLPQTGQVLQAIVTTPDAKGVADIIRQFSSTVPTSPLASFSASVNTEQVVKQQANLYRPGSVAEVKIVSLNVASAQTTTTQPAANPALPTTPPSPTTTAGLQAYGQRAGAMPTSPVSATPTAPITTPSIPLTVQPTPGQPTVPLLTGQVIGAEAQGDTVVKTALGIIKLPLETTLPTGSTLTLSLQSLIPTPAAQNATAPQPLPSLLQDWPALKELVAVVRDTQKENAPKILQNILPMPDKQFGAKVLSFMAAVRTGDVQQWLGPQVTQFLQRTGRDKLLERLTQDISTLRSAFADTATQLTTPLQNNWQALAFPVYDGQELHQARMFIRSGDDQEGKNQQQGSQDARFVVEVELQSVGLLQFDGLVRKQEQKRFFDLLIRSHTSLPKDMQVDIFTIFSDALSITGLKGGLNFQVMAQFPVQPSQEIYDGISTTNSGSFDVKA